MDGFKALGELVVGTGRSDGTSPAYVAGMREGYGVQTAGFQRDKMREEARKARAMAIARDAIPEAIRTAGYAENVQPLAAAILQANSTMDLDQLGDLAVPGAAAAYAAGADKLRAGDVSGYNDELAIATNKPREPYELAAGGKATFRPDTGAVDLTDLGTAALAATRAQETQRLAAAGTSGASARAHDAMADLRARTDPNRPRAAATRGAGTSNPAVASTTPPVQGARKAKDGFWYVPDPARPGKWLRVDGDG